MKAQPHDGKCIQKIFCVSKIQDHRGRGEFKTCRYIFLKQDVMEKLKIKCFAQALWISGSSGISKDNLVITKAQP